MRGGVGDEETSEMGGMDTEEWISNVDDAA